MSKTLKERAAELKMKDKSQRVVGVERQYVSEDPEMCTAAVEFSSRLSDDELLDFRAFAKTWKPS